MTTFKRCDECGHKRWLTVRVFEATGRIMALCHQCQKRHRGALLPKEES